MDKVGLGGGDIRSVESGMRELLRAVGAKALGQYLEQQDEEDQEEAVVCQCGKEMDYQFKRQAKILSVFGWASYRRKDATRMTTGHMGNVMASHSIISFWPSSAKPNSKMLPKPDAGSRPTFPRPLPC